MQPKIQIALVDDHVLLRAGLSGLIESFSAYQVLFEADNGKDFIQKLEKKTLPDLVLMDINMPEMNGYETTQWLKTHYPQVKVLALSMYDNETAIVKMLRAGVKGFILKDCEPAALKQAINAVMQVGFHYTEKVTGKLISIVSRHEKEVDLNERELEFLRLVCSERTYKEIADEMNKGVRTIDGYRDTLFEKLDVKTRVGLVLYAIKNGIVHISASC
ncbi:MAG: response regulator transcription factor [Williamsia sp.]|nr:response regulator transcription factor [Williamsia sp.]